MSRTALEAHAAACREAVAEGRERPRWVGGSLAMADLSGADLSGVDLTGTDLSGVDLVGADLTGADLTRANLSGARLFSANLSGANFTSANLSGANFFGANLAGANFTGANLFGAVFRNADLNGADLSGARLDEGVASGRAIGDNDGNYQWWAAALEDGSVILQYGCVRARLTWWLAQGPELGVRLGHSVSHWAEGPAVAIAAAVELSQALAAGVRR